MASAAVLAISLAMGGCETVFVAKTVSEIPTTAPPAGHAVDWSKPIPAKILIADFTLGVPPTEFVVGQAYQLEIRNVSASGRSFVAPGFFRAITVRQLVVSTGKPRLEQAGFGADAMEALAYRTAEVIAAMLPPGFELVDEPDDSFVLNLTPEQEAALAQPVAPAGDLPANPFALGGEVAGELPANPFALAGDGAEIADAAAAEADLGGEVLALVEEPAAPEIGPEVADAPMAANLEEMIPEEIAPAEPAPLDFAANVEPLEAVPDVPEVLIVDEAEELTLLAEWTALEGAFAAPSGLDLPPNSSMFLTFAPTTPGTFEVRDSSRIAGLGARGVVTFVNPGDLARLPEAARAAADLALLIGEARDGLTVEPPTGAIPTEASPAAAEPPAELGPPPAPMLPPGAELLPGADDLGPPDDI